MGITQWKPKTEREIEAAANLFAAFVRHRHWSNETFGPPDFRGPRGSIAHLRKECDEALAALDNPHGSALDAIKEVADLVILAFDAAGRIGLTANGLASIIHSKMTENESREWPKFDPNAPDNGQPVEHIRTTAEQAAKHAETNRLEAFAALFRDALQDIAEIAGDLPDERIATATGPIGAAARGTLLARVRNIARQTLRHAGQPEGGAE